MIGIFRTFLQIRFCQIVFRQEFPIKMSDCFTNAISQTQASFCLRALGEWDTSVFKIIHLTVSLLFVVLLLENVSRRK